MGQNTTGSETNSQLSRAHYDLRKEISKNNHDPQVFVCSGGQVWCGGGGIMTMFRQQHSNGNEGT